ncbi:class A beta-lactamase [Polaromonas aquatica]|uniref:class A beta-lactamase n=1 Tax=Polaromonas aquatica TaxID=332657 RepID=UPI003D65139A
MQRRQFTGTLGSLMLAGMASAQAQNLLGIGTARQVTDASAVTAQLKALEQESGGRLGIAILNTGTGVQYGHRTGERFPMCSTFKLLAAALVLHRVDTGKESLDRQLPVDGAALVAHSPVTGPRAGGSMSLAELCEATVTVSDNTAANLMLASFGGPMGLTRYARSLGDRMTRLDRIETALNEARPGDPRDTTTPAAMLGTVQKIVLGNSLSDASRRQMRQWLTASKTSDRRLRALLPRDCEVGDKTGTGAHGTTNDIGVLWPAGHAPVVITMYLTESQKPLEQREAIVAKAGQLAVSLATPA